MVGAACPRCAQSVALHEGRPCVSASGAIELWHQSCFAVRHSRPVEEVTVIAPPERSRIRPHVAVAGAGLALLAFATVGWAHRKPEPPMSLATVEPQAAEGPT